MKFIRKITIKTGCLFLFLVLFAFSYSKADFSIGLGYPYLSAKYNFSLKIASEIRYATGEGINVFAGRGYYNFYNLTKLSVFTGLEVGYIIFDTLDMKGSGYMASLFIGGEYFILDRLSLALDLAPTLISLQSDDFKVAGIEWVTNLAVYYHFSF